MKTIKRVTYLPVFRDRVGFNKNNWLRPSLPTCPGVVKDNPVTEIKNNLRYLLDRVLVTGLGVIKTVCYQLRYLLDRAAVTGFYGK